MSMINREANRKRPPSKNIFRWNKCCISFLLLPDEMVQNYRTLCLETPEDRTLWGIGDPRLETTQAITRKVSDTCMRGRVAIRR